jgi:hypothetical protein
LHEIIAQLGSISEIGGRRGGPSSAQYSRDQAIAQSRIPKYASAGNKRRAVTDKSLTW